MLFYRKYIYIEVYKKIILISSIDKTFRIQE